MGFSAFLLSVVLGFSLVALVKGFRNGGCCWLRQLWPAKCDDLIACVSQVLHLKDSVMVMEKPPVPSSFSQAWCCLR